MKFALTITEASPSELAKLLSLLGGSTAITVTADNTAATGDDAGDDNGPVNPNAPAVDKDGLPWDERIHSSNKQMTDKGVWRKRRGVSNETVAAVEAELKAKAGPGMPTHQPQPAATMPAPQPVPMPQPAAPAPVMQMPAPQPNAAMPMPQNGGYPTGPGYPAQPGNVVAAQPVPMQAPQPTPAAPPAMDFPTFMQHLSGQMAKRDGNGMPLIDTDYLARVTSEVATAFGAPLTVITDIMTQPRAAEMIVFVSQCLNRDGKWN